MIYDKLFDWQKSIVDKLKEKSAFGLFLDCGLGKTPVSLALAEANECDKLIIVTINSKATEGPEVKGSWWDWASKSKINYKIKNKQALQKDPDSPCDVLIVNYEYLYDREATKRNAPRRGVYLRDEIKKFIHRGNNGRVAIILDESHKVKDLQTNQTKAIQNIIRECIAYFDKRYLYLLTGTPFTVGFIDLYAQLMLLGCRMTKKEFKDRFCIIGDVNGLKEWQQPIVGYKHVDELYNLVHKYAITIKSEDVVQLPEKVFINHEIKQSKYFNLLTKENLPIAQIKDEINARGLDFKIEPKKNQRVFMNPFYRNLDFPEINFLADTAGTYWMRCRQASIGFQGNAEDFIWYDDERLNQIRSFLEENPDNYIIFYNYSPEYAKLFEICSKLNYNIDTCNGSEKSFNFYNAYSAMTEEEKFNNRKNVILANFASGSTGMNWQEYSKCIIFSTPLYKDWEQGIKRINRIGQKNTTIYHLFYQNNWLDKSMKESLDEKTQYTEEMFKNDLKLKGGN